jgi:hypothetical protein
MLGRPGITFDDVVLACVRLKQQKRRVGACNVRLELGKGCLTVISRHLRHLALVEVGGGVIKRGRREKKLRGPQKSVLQPR